MNTTNETTYSETLAKLTADKWQVVNEGPSGAQLRQPKKMKTLDTIVLVLGVVCLFFAWPLGLLFIVLALLDLAFFTKERTHFLSRENPRLP
jgi:preprotein translocase subunit SecF